MERPKPTGRERHFKEDEIIVSKTDLRGRLTYVNRVFCTVGLYSEAELIGQPHSIVRHPDMPRCVFHLLWERIQSGHEIFAYVKNMAKNGDHYWVLAHVTPSYSSTGKIDGYHSNRRVPDKGALDIIQNIYRDLLAVEIQGENRKESMSKASETLSALLKSKHTHYDEFIFSLAK